MSDAMKRLEEIEQQAKYLRAEFVPLITCRKAADSVELLARLVRSVAEAECEYREPVVGNHGSCADTFADVSLFCHPCRIRRELAGGVR